MVKWMRVGRKERLLAVFSISYFWGVSFGKAGI